MKLLAIDQSLSCTGIAIFQNKKLLDYYTIKTFPKNILETRIYTIVKEIEQIIKLEDIEIVCLEESLAIRNGATSRKLAGLRHAITFKLEEMKMLYHVIAPSQHKGREKKEATINRIEKDYNIKITDDNIADAISLGAYFLNNINIESGE
jgi:Holliday junction resolvasome RuvABC endonuclease subunit